MNLQPLTSKQTTSQDGVAASSKLAKSAREFEAILLQSWLEKMNQSFVGSSESQDAAHDTVSSLGTQAIATALAARGGVGIARMLLRQLQTTATAKQEVSAADSNRRLKPGPPSADEG